MILKIYKFYVLDIKRDYDELYIKSFSLKRNGYLIKYIPIIRRVVSELMSLYSDEIFENFYYIIID